MGFRNSSNLPLGWKMQLLDKLAKRGSGHTPDKSMPHYYDGGIKWVSLADSSSLDFGYISKTKKQISEEGIKNSSAVIHPPGTVILSRDAGVGKSAVLAEPMAVSQHFIAWQCDNTKNLNNWFLYYWLQMMKPEFERQAVGSTIKTIGLPYFKKLKIGTPEIYEQQKIAQILSTWDKAIEKLGALIAAKQKRKKAMMQQLLIGNNRFPGFKEEWKEYKLGELCHFKRGKGLSKEMLISDGKYKCILYGELYTKYDDVIGNIVSRTNEADSIKSVCGDVLIPSSTTTSGIDLANAVALLEDDVLLGGDINILRPNTKKVCSEFLAYLLTHIKKHQIASRAQGATIVHLYGSDLKPLLVKLPDIKEQQKIAAVISTADKEIIIHQNQLTMMKQQKKGLMQQLLTGKKRINVGKVV